MVAAVVLCTLAATIVAGEYTPLQNVLGLLESDPALSTFTGAVGSTNSLHRALSGNGPFTVFAPSNDAFAKIGKEELAKLLDPENSSKLEDLLGVHVIAGSVLHTGDLQRVQNVKSFEGQDLSITNGQARDGAEVRVGFPYQLYWPELPARVITADRSASNAVVHIIDTVLQPPPTMLGVQAGTALPNLLDLLGSNPALSSFAGLLGSAKSLHQTLSGNGPFTLFVPSNGAFAKLGKGDLANLLDHEDPSKVEDLLGVHIIVGSMLHVTDLQRVQNVNSLEGQTLSITCGQARDGDEVRVGFPYQLYWPELPARATSTDNNASNAVIHVIDTVLRPPVRTLLV